jgi:hypothetical protein
MSKICGRQLLIYIYIYVRVYRVCSNSMQCTPARAEVMKGGGGAGEVASRGGWGTFWYNYVYVKSFPQKLHGVRGRQAPRVAALRHTV